MSTATLERPAAIYPEQVLKANTLGRLGGRWFNYLRLILGTPSQRRLGFGGLQVGTIRHWETEYSRLTDADIRKQGQLLRGRARSGESLDKLLPEAFGLSCVACWRHLRLRPFDVQLAAGVVLHQGGLAEVATGEGKTLIAVLPAGLHALTGKGVHVTTVNDYLARRDGEFTAPVFAAMGITVGTLQGQMGDEDKVLAYKADITYGTSSEFGFDFLRDRLKTKSQATKGKPFWSAWAQQEMSLQTPDNKFQREKHYYALVDEADNVFIDEARTPLIIASPTRPASEEEQVVYRWGNKLALTMVRDVHFYLDEKKRKVELTDKGRELIRYSNPPVGPHSHAMDKLHEHVERSIHANHRYRLDQHYLIDQDKVVIIDEYTGRPQPDRHWQEGLHQAVEAKEGVPITMASDHAAQITLQSYFRLYEKLSGMTGTAVQSFWELRRVYKIWVVCVPTNKPCVRVHFPDRVFANETAKFDAVVEDVAKLKAQGRPVLIGTRSVDKSESLSRRLTAAGIEHQVLNARPDKQGKEAEIIAQAGRWGTVTIATNMAGRGTDILLGGNAEFLAWAKLKDQYPTRLDVPLDVWRRTVEEVEKAENIREERKRVAAAGGLHVIATERHEARRVDRQFIGRAARQGDPGSCQFYLCMEDELLEGLGLDYQAYLEALGKKGGAESWDSYQPLFIKAQRKVERRHYRQRVDLMMYQRQRQEVLKEIGADPYVD